MWTPQLPPNKNVRLPGRGVTRVYDSGAGRPEDQRRLLLLHGWTSTAALNWYKCFPALSTDYRVVAMDQRGHGRGIRSRLPFRLEDCADDAAALIRRMDIGPVTVVGYSMGGPVAQLLWRRHPELVDGMVLCATASRLAKRDQLPRQIGALSMGASVALSVLPSGVRQIGMNLATRNWSNNNAAADWAIEEWARHDPSALIQAGLAISRFDSRPWIGDIDVPVSVVITEGDHTVPPTWQWAMANAVPGSTVFPIRADHRACVDNPEEFIPALLAACRSVQRSTTP
jgi:3-oxoadipate enol-lactonase